MEGGAIVVALNLCFYCGFPLTLLVFGFSVGTFIERAHFKRLDAREQAMTGVVVCNVGRLEASSASAASAGTLVVTEVVISSDYFKTFIATIIKLLGGEMKTYRSLMERARREAVVRLQEQASASGCDLVCNLRIETADVTGAAVATKKNPIVAVGVIASGTAVRRAA